MIDAYWDNSRIDDYYNSCKRHTEDFEDVTTFFVNIYVEFTFTFDADGHIDDLTPESQEVLATFQDIAAEIERRADNPYFEDIPCHCYGCFEELYPVEVSPRCFLPQAAVFRSVLPDSYFDVIDNVIYTYKNFVHFHIKNF